MKRITIDCPDGLIEGETADEADLDGRFVVTERDTGERLIVNGWLCTISEGWDDHA
jgi:hypothetical protein